VEKVRRDLTIQEMITNAIADYINRPPANALRLQGDSLALVCESMDDPEIQRCVELCLKYFQRMPKAKRTVLKEFIVLDLKHYGSSRLKGTN